MSSNYIDLPVENGGPGSGVTSLNTLTGALSLVAGSNVTIVPSGNNLIINAPAGGTVTSVSVTTANGFAGTSSGGFNPSLTLTTTVTGILYGNGTAMQAAIAANFPILNQNTTGTAANITGLLAPANGGTGVANSNTLTLNSNAILSGTNTGDITLSNVGSSPNGNAASLTGQVLSLQPFNSGNPGVVLASGGGNKFLKADNTWVTADSANTASTLVERDASGNFSAGTITANLTGTATNATTAVNFTGSLSGDVTGTQSATTIASTVVTGKLLTGYSVGPNSPLAATDSILSAFGKVQGQLNATSGSAVTTVGPVGSSPNANAATISGNTLTLQPANTTFPGVLTAADWNTFNNKQPAGSYITSLTGDVTATGPGAAAATVTAIRNKTVSTTAPIDAQFLIYNSGSTQYVPQGMSGDVSMLNTGAATVNSVGGSTASAVNSATILANNATSLNTADQIVKRDASGNFSAGTITANLTGTATSAVSFTGTLSGDVTGGQSSTVVATVGGKTSTQVAQSVTDTTNATNAATANTLAKRDASANISFALVNASGINLTGASGAGNVYFPAQASQPGTPVSGFYLYSSSTGAVAWKGTNGFQATLDATGITASRAYTMPDQAGTLMIDPMTTIGDMIYRNGSNVTSRLPIGSTNQVLKVSGGVPTWADQSQLIYGDGSDGNLNLTGSATLSQNTFYNTLTISGAGSLNLGNYVLFCQTLDLSNAGANAITFSGNNGNNSTATAGGAAPGATAGAYFAGTGNGTAGGASSTTTGAQAGTPTAQNPSNGGNGGQGSAGGAGAAGAQAGGAARAGSNSSNPIKYASSILVLQRNTSQILAGVGGAGGGGGGGNGAAAGTGGGSGGAGGGVAVIYAKNIITTGSTAAGAISSKGGNGGSSAAAVNANTGSGGGGGGGGGGYILLFYQTKTGGAVTNLIDASGGNGGNSGNANGTGAAGNAGQGGDGGRIDLINTASNTGTHVVGSAGSNGGTGSGTTGATGGAGGSCVASL